MKHLLKIKHMDMNMDATIPEWVIFNDEKAHLLYKDIETDRYLFDLPFGIRFGRLKDYHRELYLTPNGSYVMSSYHEGEKPDYEVLSKDEAATFVRDRDKEAYIKIFKPREL